MSDTITPGKVIVAELELTADDLAQGIKLLRGKGIWILVPICFMPLWFSQISVNKVELSAVLPFVLLMGLVAYFVILQGPKKLAQKNFDALSPERRSLHYEFTAQGVAVTTKVASSTFQYSALYGYKQGPDCFALYTTPQIAEIVPKRAFTEMQQLQLQKWITTQVTPWKGQGRSLRSGLILWIILIVSLLVVWQLLGPGSR